MEDTARNLAERALWSAERRTLEADLRSDLAQILVPYALDELKLPPETIRQEGSGMAGRFDSMFGSAIIEYKAPQLLRIPRERQIAAEQAIGYLNDPQLGARVVIVTDGETWGILRDIGAGPDQGEQLALDLREGEKRIVPPVARFSWRPISEQTANVVLELIASQRSTAVTSSTLIAYMGLGRHETLGLLRELASTLRNRSDGNRTDLLFNQWILTAGISYGINDPSTAWPTRQQAEQVLPRSILQTLTGCTFAETVYCLHTYIAIAAKMVAAEVLAIQKQQPDWRPTQWRFLDDRSLAVRLGDLESGLLSEQLGAPGLLQSNLFDWYAHDSLTHESLLSALRKVLEELAHLAWAQVANAGGMKIDLLRDLYQEVVPPKLRKALGEFFTPRWLAEYTLMRALQACHEQGIGSDSRMPRLLDPACGSGTFLVAAMRVALQKLDLDDQGNDPQLLMDLTQAVVGIDVNPVSALMSRVNLLLALGDRTRFLSEVTFQVFQADSIILPRVHVGQMHMDLPTEHVLISTTVSDFRLHPALMSQSRMGILRQNLESAVRSGTSEHPGLPVDLFLGSLRGELIASGCSDEEFTQMQPSVLQLYEQLKDLRRDDKDDVWARVLEQFVAPFLLGEFDLVIGNPPWVSWKNLPDAWKERSQPLWRAWGLWKTRTTGRGVPLSDISTLLFARSLLTYAPHGLVAMLLPKSVQLADPGGNAFRRSHLRPDSRDRIEDGTDTNIKFRTLMIDDFVSVNPFSPDASNQTIVLYAQTNRSPRFPVPIRRWKRRARSRIKASWGWHQVVANLQAENSLTAPVDPKNIESPWGLVAVGRGLTLVKANRAGNYHFGRGYETRGLDGLFTFSILTPRPLGDQHEIRVRNMPDEGRNTADEAPREGPVEGDLFWPLVKGEDVSRWKVNNSGRYLFVPYDVELTPWLQLLPLVVLAPTQGYFGIYNHGLTGLHYAQCTSGKYLRISRGNCRAQSNIFETAVQSFSFGIWRLVVGQPLPYECRNMI